MGYAQLLARLERETDARVAAIEAAARAELTAVLAEHARHVGAAREKELAARRAVRRARLDGELARARQAAGAAVLEARRAVVERVLARATALVDAADGDPRFLDAAPEQAREALRYLDDRPAVVRCRPALAARLRSALGVGTAVRVEDDPGCPAGMRLASADGAVTIDDTLATRLIRAGEELAPEWLGEVDP